MIKLDCYYDIENLLGKVFLNGNNEVISISSIEWNWDEIIEFLDENNCIDWGEEDYPAKDQAHTLPLRSYILKVLEPLFGTETYLDPEWADEPDEDVEWEHMDDLVLPGVILAGFRGGEETTFEVQMAMNIKPVNVILNNAELQEALADLNNAELQEALADLLLEIHIQEENS